MKTNSIRSVDLMVYSTLAVVTVSTIAGCKPQERADLSPMSVATSATATPTSAPINKQSLITGKPLTAAQMFTKQGTSDAEAKTVDAILTNLDDFGSREKDVRKAVEWAERNLKMLALDGYGLTNVAPILFFKNIETLTLSGNKLTQDQFDQLLAGLPKLKTISKDPGLKCDQYKYPRVRCLE